MGVEAEFLNSGYLPPGVRDQVIRKGVAVDFPAVNGGIPICKDFLKGKCTREARCRFRHVNAMEYDMEMNSYQTGSRRRSHLFHMIQDENHQLRNKIAELEKRVS